jgi:hypothetical protein
MGVVSSRATAPGILFSLVLNWRAGQITDPVSRLRFLRRTTLLVPSTVPLTRAAVALLGLAVILIPIPVITRAGLFRETLPPAVPAIRTTAAEKLPSIWLVEKKDDFEVYSNGLRIETRGAAFHSLRKYPALDATRPEQWKGAIGSKWESAPAGIVFHTTESDLAPFEESQNEKLQRLAQGIVSYVRRRKSYHYLIDRFGRVIRVVDESSIANHAGHSAWADSKRAYVNLNQSFLGVSFEAKTRPEGGSEAINAAQIHSGRILTQMLRGKYRIAPENCVTHAQVSMNPDNFRVGAHTDFGTQFPFGEMGLPDNYDRPLPSIVLFGFTYDSGYLQTSEAQLWSGLLMAQEKVREAAVVRHLKLEQYRAMLRSRYKDLVSALKALSKEESL